MKACPECNVQAVVDWVQKCRSAEALRLLASAVQTRLHELVHQSEAGVGTKDVSKPFDAPNFP